MVVVNYPYTDMKKLSDLPLEKVVDGLNNLGAPSEYDKETKSILSEITPNRPDWYSIEGLARSLIGYYTKKHPKYQTKKSLYQVIVDPSVAKIRPYTVCAVVKGMKFSDDRIISMIALQERLMNTLGRKVKKFGLGIYPLDKIVFPVSYTTMRPKDIRYIPLGYSQEMDAENVLQNHKKGQQYGHIIKGQERYPVFIDAENKVMCLIPIVNSAETGKVDENTTDVFIEVSGMDIHACKAALNILVCMFADMGGEVFQVKVKYKNGTLVVPELAMRIVDFDLEEINKTLGLALTKKEVVGLLERMGYGSSGNKLLVPPYRADVIDLVDVIEDVAIAYGYNNFKPTLPDFFHPGKSADSNQELRRTMVGMGFLEINTFILTNKDKLDRIGYVGRTVEVKNPASEDFTTIRPTLIQDILESFSNNKVKGLPQKLFEIGIVDGGRRFCFGLMDRKIEFSDFKGYLQTIGLETGQLFELVREENKLFDKDISCSIRLRGKIIGVIGKIDSDVLNKYGIEFEVYLVQIVI
ncbi:phenylalanine--tRNA ligase subunit beta [Candidatus Micrarchaeota archaeon]|nr:phenylalanine--tRNA ligase subunit beta [Candidatus Micrarchaeota archaeon]